MFHSQEEYDRLVEDALYDESGHWMPGSGLEDDDADDYGEVGGSRLRRVVLILVTLLVLAAFIAIEVAPLLQPQPTPPPPVYRPMPTAFPSL